MVLGEYTFKEVHLVFKEDLFEDVFVHKNNKSLADTLAHLRYAKLNTYITNDYLEWLDKPLGIFLYHLKNENNLLYRKFLNKYGDGKYCQFSLEDKNIGKLKGIYCFTLDNTVKYIGRCRDSFKKRINDGYGKIHPKNCYVDGQATNCHMNALIAENLDKIRFLVCALNDETSILSAERELIAKFNPSWNIALSS